MRIVDIVKAAGGVLRSGNPTGSVTGVSIDSRTIKKGEVFIAIKGKNFDGHDFICRAIEKGACAVVCSKIFGNTAGKAAVVVVSDTLWALGDIAAYHRNNFKIPVIGITGSNGKTTTKEMTAHVLGARFNVLKNKGTENNFVGLPLTLLRLKPTHEAAVIEMGTNHIGEIDRLSQILRPTMGIIANIGPSHLEYFKNLNTVLKAKSEILNNMPKGARLILNADDEHLSKIRTKLRTITFGILKKSDFRAVNIKQSGQKIEFNLNGKALFKLNMVGRHNVYNALASVAAAATLGVDRKTIQESLRMFKPLSMRLELSVINGIKFLDDTYNANPLSSAYAIQSLSDVDTQGKKILVMGDMLELGPRAKGFHRDAGKIATKSNIDRLITVGRLSKDISVGARLSGMDKNFIWSCNSLDKAASILAEIISPGDVVLVKGSRAMGMEKIIEKLKIKSKK